MYAFSGHCGMPASNKTPSHSTASRCWKSHLHQLCNCAYLKLSIEASGGEVMSVGITQETPLRVPLDSRQCYIAGGWHICEVEP